MFLKKIVKPAKTSRCVFSCAIALSVFTLLIYYVFVFSIVSENSSNSISPIQWYTANVRIDEPRFFSPQDAFEEIPNLPTAYLSPNFSRVEYRWNDTCAHYPDVLQLSLHNLHWQTFSFHASKWYLFAAYYENRSFSDVKPAIRVLAAIDLVTSQDEPFCQVWYPRSRQPLIVRSSRPELVWKRPRGQNKFIRKIAEVFMVTCPIPPSQVDLIPDSVSLVEHKCSTATNHLKVIYNKANLKQDIAVCVTPLNLIGLDYSVRLVEWIELVRLLGADKIFLYYLHHHENVTKVLRYYEDKGIVQPTQFSLPDGQPNSPMLQRLYLRNVGEYVMNQHVAQQDCLYRNMYNYEYTVLLDVDEVIIPLEVTTWKELLKTVSSEWRKRATSFCVSNCWFHDDDTHPSENYSDVPSYLHMLKHVHRTGISLGLGRRISDVHSKCFRFPEKVKFEGNHGPISCFGGCLNYLIPPAVAQLQHYCDHEVSHRCSGKENMSIRDTTIWRYKTALVERVLPTLNKLGFLD